MRVSLWLPNPKSRVVHTKLGRPLAVDSCVCPVIRPINFPGFSDSENGFDGEGHSWFTDSDRLVLGIMWYPWWRMELGIYAMATPRRDDTTFTGLGVFLNGFPKISKRRARLNELDCLIQAFSCRFNHPDRICVRLGSIADVVRLIEIGVITVVI